MRSITRFSPRGPTSATRQLLSPRLPARATTKQHRFARRFWANPVRRRAIRTRAKRAARSQGQAARKLRRSPKAEDGRDCAPAILPHESVLAVAYERQDFSAVRCSCCEAKRGLAQFAIAARSKLHIPRNVRRATLALRLKCLRCVASRSVAARGNEGFRSNGTSRHGDTQRFQAAIEPRLHC